MFRILALRKESGGVRAPELFQEVSAAQGMGPEGPAVCVRLGIVHGERSV